MQISYDLDKIKYSTDEATLIRAMALYEKGKVTQVEQKGKYYFAIVLGTEPYDVSVSVQNYQKGDCNCYLGKRDILCKHIVALAIYTVKNGEPLTKKDKQLYFGIECSNKRDFLNEEELKNVKKMISEAVRYIKPYKGSYSTWEKNQDSLQEGCNRLKIIISNLPVNKQSAEIVVKLLLRIDKKLCTGGVDDSNGIVGEFIYQCVDVLEEYAEIDSKCIDAFELLVDIDGTISQWEESLVQLWDDRELELCGLKIEEDNTFLNEKRTTNKRQQGFVDKQFIKEEEFNMVNTIFEIMPFLNEYAKRYNIKVKDIISFAIVAKRCTEERELKELTFKQVSIALKRPQRQFKEIEKCELDAISVKVLESYIDFLNLRKWFDMWKKANMEVYENLAKNKN